MQTAYRLSPGFACIAAFVALGVSLVQAAPDKVKLVRTPNGGLQPQALVDAKRVVHLVYYKGEAKAGDLFYTRQEPGQDIFSKPLQVNTRAGSAIAVGTIRGAQLAMGRNGRVHVAWNGSKSIDGAKHKGAPMWYTRLNDAGTGFDPERDMMTFTGGLDGGGTVAADDRGNVYVLWHGSAPDSPANEAARAVFMARSSDDGGTFAPEQQASSKSGGACGCCGMRAFADARGNVFALYRAALDVVNRDEVMLISRDQGASFEKVFSHPWNIASCPMSSAWLAESQGGTLAAWETAGQVYFANADAKTSAVSKPIAPPGAGKRKHPVAVANAAGDVLLAWTEGTGWQRGGAVAWQLFDGNGQPTGEKGRVADAVPVWGLIAAVAQAGGSFVVFH